ncbi:FGGY family carbohydrate kinase [Amnibacterium sp. CER49]|uniref:FGGY family carbohydrate kinase n=1 Tax=Amnibacterium sp. CER49 TaxID=3039161 RepID=UPI00244747B4|nr:FGGY family carbohydrate kinase [Amnibacterium sp. CER49]MDH2442932.1 FGGY family carbohydrate kinase [Amnibacterium sp. CER49]
MSSVLAVDCGTHAVRAIVFGPQGSRVLAERPLPLDHGPRGAVHIDPDMLAQATVAVVRASLEQCRRGGEDVTALGLTNMRETLLAWSRSSGRALAPGIMWLSEESRPVVDRWRREGREDRIRALTGLANETFFFGSKLVHLLETSLEVATAAARGDLAVGTIDVFLLHVLTAGRVHATEPTNASRTQLLDIGTGAWSAELCDALGVPEHCLPAVLPSSGMFGVTDPDVTGASIPITGVLADQQASLLGHGCETPGAAKATLGTSGVVCVHLGDRRADADGLLTSLAWSAEQGPLQYELEGSAFSCGYTNSWVNDHVVGARDVPRDISIGRAASEDDRVLLVPSFAGLGAPRWPSGRGAVLAGLGMSSTPADVVRAGLEAMAFQIHDLMLAATDALGPVSTLSVDGGGSRSDYVCALLADLTGVPVVRQALSELTCAGVAMAAARGGEQELALPDAASGASRFEPGDPDYARRGYDRWSELVHQVLERPREESPV